VAYQIRYDARGVSPHTRVKFMTDGILLQVPTSLLPSLCSSLHPSFAASLFLSLALACFLFSLLPFTFYFH
jgi:hypothetical protein